MRSALALLVLACCHSSSGGPPAEVVLVSTQHFITDMPDGYQPAHLRALLGRIKPDLLVVEAPANVGSPWEYAPYELAQVTRPWAEEHQLPIVPGGHLQADYGPRIDSMIADLEKVGKGAEYRAVEDALQKGLAQLGASCQAMNSRASLDSWRTYHRALHRLLGADTPWEKWNDRIFDNLIDLLRKSPGKRVAVVFGGAHAYYFNDRLAAHPALARVLPTDAFLPLPNEEVAAARRPLDSLKALRLLNFQNWGAMPTASLARLEQRLEEVRAVPELTWDYRFYRGKALLHHSEPTEAIDAFREAARAAPQVISSFDGTTRIHEASLVFVAISEALAGQREAAQRDLEAVLADKDTSTPIRDWCQQLLKAPPPALR